MIWTCAKGFGPDQNKLDPSQTIRTRTKGRTMHVWSILR